MSEQISDFLTKQFPAVDHIIGRGILPVKGKLIIGGAPKTGKSFFILNVAIDLAMGRPLFNAHYSSKQAVFPVYERNRVLYIEQEVGEIGLQTRLKSLLLDEPMTGVNLFIKSRDTNLRMDTEKGQEAIAEEIAAVKPDVVILDPLAKFHLVDENSSQHMGAMMRVGDGWIEKYGCAVIYVHHTGHQNPQNPKRGGDKLRGSTAIFADADSIIIVERQSASNIKEPVLQLNFELRRGEPLEAIYIKRRQSGLITYEAEGVQNPAMSFAPQYKNL